MIESGFLIPTGDRPCGVAVDATYIYWGTENGGTIGRARLDGSDANPNFIVGPSSSCGIAVDGSHVYWADILGQTMGRADLDGTNLNREFVAGLNGPCGVAVDGRPSPGPRGAGRA